MNEDQGLVAKVGYSYDATGLKEARADATDYKAKILMIDAEITRTRAKLQSDFTLARRQEMEKQARDSQGVAQQEAAAWLASYRTQVDQLNSLKQARSEMLAQLQQTKAATTLLSAGVNGGAPWPVAREFTMTGLLQGLGIVSLGASLPGMLRGIGDALKDAALSGGEYAHNLELISAKTGVTVPELQKWESVGKTAGLGLDDITTATRTFAKAIVGGGDDLEGAVSKGGKVLGALGIATHDAAGNARPLTAVMENLAEVFARTPDGPEKSAIAVTLFGRAGRNLIPILDKGKQGIADLFAEFGDMPDVSELAKSYEQLEIASAKLDLANLRLKTSLSPVIDLWAQLKDGAAAYIEQLTAAEQYQKNMAGAAGVKLTPAGQAMMSELTQPVYPVMGRETMTVEPVDKALQEKLAAGEAAYRQRFAAGIAPGAVLTDEQRALGYILAQQDKTNEKLVQEVELRKQVTEQVKNAARIASGEKTGPDRQAESMAKRIERARQSLTDTQAKGVQAGEWEQNKEDLTPLAAATIKVLELERELQAVKEQESKVQGQALLDNLEKQKALTGEVAATERERSRALATSEAQYLKNSVWSKLQTAFPGIKDLVPSYTVNPPTHQQVLESQLQNVKFSAPSELRTTQSFKDELAIRERLDAEREQEITGLLSESTLTKQQSENLKKLESDYTANAEAIKRLQAVLGKTKDPIAQTMDVLADVVSKFSGGLPKGLSEFFAGWKAIEALSKSFSVNVKSALVDLGKPQSDVKQANSPLGALTEMFSSWDNFKAGVKSGSLGNLIGIGATIGANFKSGLQQGIGSIMSTAAVFDPEPISKAALAIGAAMLQLFSFGKKARQISADIAKNIQGITDALAVGSLKLKDAISQLEVQRASAVAQLSGRKGGQALLDQLLPGIDQSLAQLQAQQKTAIDSFEQELRIARLPDAFQSIGTSIEDLNKKIQDFLDAGGSYLDAQEFLARSIQQIYKDTQKTLQGDELNTINLLQQEIDLHKQRAKVVSDEADQERQIRLGLGIGIMLTPAQQAAQQIATLRQNRDDQLQQIDQQIQETQAQTTGQQALFGLAQDMNSLEAAKLLIMQQQSKEVTDQITALQEFLALNKDAIAAAQAAYPTNSPLYQLPQLVNGTLAAGGTQTSISIATVQVTASPDMSPQNAWTQFRNGLSYGMGLGPPGFANLEP